MTRPAALRTRTAVVVLGMIGLGVAAGLYGPATAAQPHPNQQELASVALRVEGMT